MKTQGLLWLILIYSSQALAFECSSVFARLHSGDLLDHFVLINRKPPNPIVKPAFERPQSKPTFSGSIQGPERQLSRVSLPEFRDVHGNDYLYSIGPLQPHNPELVSHSQWFSLRQQGDIGFSDQIESPVLQNQSGTYVAVLFRNGEIQTKNLVLSRSLKELKSGGILDPYTLEVSRAQLESTGSRAEHFLRSIEAIKFVSVAGRSVIFTDQYFIQYARPGEKPEGARIVRHNLELNQQILNQWSYRRLLSISDSVTMRQLFSLIPHYRRLYHKDRSE